jgi:hypothetical protein
MRDGRNPELMFGSKEDLEDRRPMRIQLADIGNWNGRESCPERTAKGKEGERVSDGLGAGLVGTRKIQARFNPVLGAGGYGGVNFLSENPLIPNPYRPLAVSPVAQPPASTLVFLVSLVSLGSPATQYFSRQYAGDALLVFVQYRVLQETVCDEGL